MNKRQRKKWLKQHNKYINPKDTWSLDYVIAEFVLPRLKLFKKVNNGYPGRDGMETPEQWDEALDKMILAFQLVIDTDNLQDRYWSNNNQFNKELWINDQNKIQEGLNLFATWFQHLWW